MYPSHVFVTSVAFGTSIVRYDQAASNPAYAELRRFCLNPASLELSNPASSDTTSS